MENVASETEEETAVNEPAESAVADEPEEKKDEE